MSNRLIQLIKDQSLRVKALLAAIGILLISTGYLQPLLFPDSRWIGFGFTFVGLTMDIGIMFVLYLEIGEIRDEIEQTEDEVEEAKVEIQGTKEDIETIFDSTFSSMSKSKGGFYSLEDRLEKIKNELEREHSSRAGTLKSEIETLERRIDELEGLEQDINGTRGLESRVKTLEDKFDRFDRGLRK